MCAKDLGQRDMLLAGCQAGVVALVVELLAFGVMCWQHQGQALTGIVVGMVLVVASLGVMLYRLGQVQRVDGKAACHTPEHD